MPMLHILSIRSVSPTSCVFSYLSRALPSAAPPRHHPFASVPNQDESASPKRKTRRRTQSIDEVPSLSEFMHRSKVLKQYRSFVRLALFLDGQSGGTGECRAALDEVRVSYRSGVKKGTDSLSKSMAFSEGERRLKELQSMVGFVPKKQSTPQSDSAAADEKYDADSWMNIKDEDDKRGRVGVQWPWENGDDKK